MTIAVEIIVVVTIETEREINIILNLIYKRLQFGGVLYLNFVGIWKLQKKVYFSFLKEISFKCILAPSPMNTLINRFFTKDVPRKVVHEPNKNQRHSLLHYLIDQGSNTFRLREIKKQTLEFVFSDEDYIADLELVQRYLELERYLLYSDPRFISTEKKTRESIKLNFPKFTDSQAFSPLYQIEKNQELTLALNYIHYVLQTFGKLEKSNTLASKWGGYIGSNLQIETDFNRVRHIHNFRKLKERTRTLYSEFVSSFDKDWVEETFKKCHKEFGAYYCHLSAFNSVLEFLPLNLGISDNLPATKGLKSTVKKATKKLITKDAKSIFENILDGFILFDRKGNIIDYNNNAVEILGVAKDELRNRSVLSFFPDDLSLNLKTDLEKIDLTIPNLVIGKRQESMLITNLENANYFEISITNNYTEERDTYSMFLKDITNKKETLKAISEAKINAERTAKAKATFLSNMSHEIRTPLNVILGLSEIITKSNLDDEVILRKNLDGIDFSAKNLLSIVNDILDFSKIEAGKLSIQAIDFNLKKMVTTLADGFKIKANEKGLDLVSEFDTDIPNVMIGDQYRLTQVLNNLIGNAIKFTNKGHVKISVTMDASDDDEIRLLFKVEDTGIGIDQDNLDRIFDSFYQVENSENSKINGTGLGLAITKELIYLQNGIFNANSVLDQGSVFEFTLPFGKSKLKGIEDSISTYIRDDKKLNGLKVLVAEDNQMNQFYIKQLLNNLNVIVDIATNGKEAVDIYNSANSNYDLILMDMHMPILSGIDAISSIRRSNKDALKKVPIVACSADVFPEARKNAIKAGIDFYLTKPLNEEAVKEVLYWLVSDEETIPEISIESNLPQAANGEIRSNGVDINLLNATFDNDEEFIISLLEVFIQETPDDYNSMRNCIEREFYLRASSLAHKMKSSFQNLGMTNHGHHLQQIEANIIKKESLAEAKRHFKIFSQLYTKALLEVNILLIELRQK